MTKKAIHAADAPAAIGPYSQAVVAGDTMWLSGQIALDPVTMTMIGETAAEQAVQVLENLGAVLRAADFSYDDLVQCTIYLADMNDFNAINQVYARYMPTPPPARATVEVSRLPRDVKIEIGAVAKRA